MNKKTDLKQYAKRLREHISRRDEYISRFLKKAELLKDLPQSVGFDKDESRLLFGYSFIVALSIVVLSLSVILMLNPERRIHTPETHALYSSLMNEIGDYEKLSGIGGIEYEVPSFLLTKYTVQEGENLTYIAKKTGIRVDTIISVNKLENAHNIQIGKKIMIPNRNGIMHTVDENESLSEIASTFSVSEEKIREVNELTSVMIKAGSEIFVPGARFSGVERAEKLGLVFIKPLSRFRITSTYGYRRDPFTKRRTFHRGVDMAFYSGAPIYAAKEGKVIFAGPKGGYGNLVIILHVNGYRSYYAHMKRFACRSGQYVQRGQKIGYVGATGRAKGSHLHFEIRRYGRAIDPLSITSLH